MNVHSCIQPENSIDCFLGVLNAVQVKRFPTKTSYSIIRSPCDIFLELLIHGEIKILMIKDIRGTR